MKKNNLTVSPMIIAGVLMVLLPIFTLMTLDRLKRQKEFFTQRLLEKGVSLIRTFEAGTRTGMLTMKWGGARIQDMLLETTFQPEVVFMLIVSKDGKILAHSDASLVGKQYKGMPSLEGMSEDPSAIYHRISRLDNEDVFEVYKRFVPLKNRSPRGARHMSMMRRMLQDSPDQGAPPPSGRPADWSSFHFRHMGEEPLDARDHYIFAGLSMKNAEIAHAHLIKSTLWRGVLFLLLGCAGVFALFVFQAYRSARASLSSVKAYSDTIIENMPSGLLTIDAGRKITGINTAAKKILGGDPSFILPLFEDLAAQVGDDPKGVTREVTVQPESGRKIRLDVTASLVRGDADNPGQHLFLFRDLTQINELKQQVETNKRLAAIGKLAAGVAHEIRNPLSSIKGFATYFGKRYQENENDREMSQIMVKEVERINRSITQLLEFAKPLKVEKGRVDIKALLSHSIKLIRHDLERKKIRVRVQDNADCRYIISDSDRMNQVLLNLYMNAIEAMDENGTLSVHTADIQKGGIEIVIEDTGCGIEEENLEKIFDPYFTTRPTDTGLGLSIVHRIIENLGGSIHIDSTPGKGSRFSIRLPSGDENGK